jgi:hypothetical protein
MPRLLSALALSVLALTPVCADEVLQDTWYEDSIGYRKTGYTHIVLTKTAQGYVEEVHEWWPLEGSVTKTQTRTETTSTGRVVGWTKLETTALGTLRSSGKLEGEVLRWKIQRREQKERSGEIKGEVFDSAVVAYLIARGERKPGEFKLRILNLPKGAKEFEFSAEKLGDQLQFTAKSTVRMYGPKGKCEQVLRTDYVGERSAVSEAEAKDMSRKPQVDAQGVTPGLYDREGIKIVAPSKVWGLAAVAEGGGEEEPVMLIHSLEVMLLVLPLEIPLPAEDEGLQVFLPQMRESLDSQDPNLNYGEGKIVTEFGLKGLRYPVTGLFNDDVEIQGQAWILRRNASQGALVMLFGPADKVAETNGLVTAARKALTITKLEEKATPAQRGTFPLGLSLEFPGGWERQTEKGREQWASPAGSHVAAWLQATRGAPSKDVAENWTQSMADKFGTTAEPPKLVKVGGRELYRSELEVENKGIKMVIRLFVGETGTNESFLMMAIDTALEKPGTIEKILKSAKWKK